VLDVAASREVMFEREKSVDPDVLPAFAGGKLYYVTSSGGQQEIWRAPGGKHAPPPLPGHRVVALRPAGAFVFVVLEEAGTNILRLVALDAQTLTPALNYGALMPMGGSARLLRREPRRYFVSIGNLMFIVSARDDGAAPDGELRVIETMTGQVVWTRGLSDVGRLDDWYVLGGCVVLWSPTSIQALDPMRGLSVARYLSPRQ
jgi:hypothetical protein